MNMLLQLLLPASFTAALLSAGPALAQTPSPGAGRVGQMNAIVYHHYGPPEVLRLEALDKPVPKDNQVLLKVRAASVNPLDSHFMRGIPYLVRLVETGMLRPKTARLGVDVAGQVEAVGALVTQFKPGDEVFGHRFGAFAEYVCATEEALVKKPANISFEQAAAVPIAGVTALQALRDKGQLRSGQSVLINGASGGVGTFAVQIAKSFGANVTGVCSGRNQELVRSIGADQVIDYTKEDFTQSGRHYDLILDTIGNHSLSELRHLLTEQGTLVQIGSTDVGLWLRPVLGMLESLAVSPFVSQRIVGILADVNHEDLTVLSELMAAGKLTPVIDRGFQLSETSEAIRYLEEGHARGKVVITVDEHDAPKAASADPAPSFLETIEPELGVLACLAIVIVAPLFIALALNRRFQKSNLGKRAYRWGYFQSLQSVICGFALGFMLESGVATMLFCGILYSGLGWFCARRQHWAWITLTVLSFNPLVWIFNAIYFWKRWAEDAVATGST